MKLRNKAHLYLLGKSEIWFRDDVRRLIARELHEVATEIRLVGLGVGPFGKTSRLWGYRVAGRTDLGEERLVWLDATARRIRRVDVRKP